MTINSVAGNEVPPHAPSLQKKIIVKKVLKHFNNKVKGKVIAVWGLSFKPLTVQNFTDEYLLRMAKKRLFMSATILSKKNMCKTLGINQDECKFIRVPSTFPVENMPIYFTNSGKMDKNSLDKNLDKIVEDVDKTLYYHELDKGIIHTHTFKITK